jgi:uncharacterized protein (UPF0332 family)
MKLGEEERDAVVQHRLEMAKETLVEAKDMADLSHWRGASNRLYYACYYAVEALLISNGHRAQTHSGVATLFSLHFMKTNIVDREHGKLYRQLFNLRQYGDYGVWAYVDEDDIRPLLAPAEDFINHISKLIGT